MKIRSLFAALVLIGSGASILAPQQAQACSCIAPGTAQEQMAQYDAAFRGTVVESDGQVDASSGAFQDVTYTLNVAEVWKGEIAATQAVKTGASSAGCGIQLEEGVEYLVFASQRDSGEISTGLCMGTRPIEQNEAYVLALGEGSVPGAITLHSPVLPLPDPISMRTESSGESIGIAIGAGVIILLLVGVVGWMLVSTRKR